MHLIRVPVATCPPCLHAISMGYGKTWGNPGAVRTIIGGSERRLGDNMGLSISGGPQGAVREFSRFFRSSC